MGPGRVPDRRTPARHGLWRSWSTMLAAFVAAAALSAAAWYALYNVTIGF
ncbi:hypothetical protein ACQP00_39165 [Dactylosporangium sp. CS-047395]